MAGMVGYVYLDALNNNSMMRATQPIATATTYPTQEPLKESLSNLTIELVMPTERPTLWVPTQEVTPTAVMTATPQQPTTYQIVAKMSYYWPPLGGINADHDMLHTADGSNWRKLYNEGIKILACPPEFPIGTKFYIRGDEWICKDRGGAIVRNPDNSYWLDLLADTMPYSMTWGQMEIVEVQY